MRAFLAFTFWWCTFTWAIRLSGDLATQKPRTEADVIALVLYYTGWAAYVFWVIYLLTKLG